MTSLKEVTGKVTLADFMLAERVRTADSNLYHVKDPQDGLWGVFDTSKGLIIPCLSDEKLREAKYGFWLVKMVGFKVQLFNPTTGKQTAPTFCVPHQINENIIIVNHDSSTHLIDLAGMRVYCDGEKSNIELQHPGFEAVSVRIPPVGKHFQVSIYNGLLILLMFASDGMTLANPFLMEMSTGEVLPMQYHGV